MPEKVSFADLVDELSRARTLARNSGDANRAKALTQEIDLAYARRRQMAAEVANGTREQIVKRARIETELERLMSDR